VKDYLKSKFSMTDLGKAAYILGIKIYRYIMKRLIGLSQDTYLDKVVKRFPMENSKKGMLPMITGKQLSKYQHPQIDEERQYMSEVPFASAIGSIMYAMICTRYNTLLFVHLILDQTLCQKLRELKTFAKYMCACILDCVKFVWLIKICDYSTTLFFFSFILIMHAYALVCVCV
jgi:hypothetical protein